ncbi:cysteine--tRNA ligase [Candidatus Saccharibacteria bacterium]|nr:cysteine--tRNA ligase [Candidatus Saccharibacteria bacterium]MBQ6127397.1 cysteine--tRNA ligase [Candidatus Saccharibacteria bacterium]
MKLYNQLSRSVEEFIPQDPKNVKIYTCGPTVYSYAHIGNFSSYIYWDLLVRTLTLNGYTVNRVLNLTDVGHLSSDADEGEDKLEKGAKREGMTVWEVADKYAKAFLDDFHALNLTEPTKIARATDYIDADLELVKKLIDKGYTYETADGIYYDTSKFKTYADFARLDLEKLKAGARVEFNSEKRNVSDFAVWKYIREGEDHAMQWEFNGHIGYPGWHLECSTIIHEELGETIDIHTGGIDHIPVHHTNEIAQSEAAFEKKLSNFWTHCNFITIDGEKVSKSLGNVYTLADLKEKGFEPYDFKLWVLQGHYRGDRNFNFEDLTAAKNRRLNWRNRIASTYQITPEATFDQKKALELVSNDLNSAELLAYIDDSILSLADWEFLDNLLGLELVKTTPKISDEVAQIIREREDARKNKNYEASDNLRDKLAAKNVTILDTENGPIWKYLH